MDATSIDFEGFTLLVPPEVYEPAEDSFLLARAAKRFATGRVLDLGCGTGIVGMAALQNPAVSFVTFADKNPEALQAARNNLERNAEQGFERHAATLEFIQSDLFANLGNPVSDAGRFDTICFNPPYLPTDESEDEKLEGALNDAFDGGVDGRSVIDRFLTAFPPFLSRDGVLLLLNSSRSGRFGAGHDETVQALERVGFLAKALEEQAFFFENLRVYKAVRART